MIDNLGNISGGADENTVDMIQIFTNLRRLAEDTGAAIIVVHHRRKSDPKDGRKGDSLRGHSSIEAALDLALLIDRENYSQTIKIQPTKVRGSDVKPLTATFTYQHDAYGELKEARFFSTQGDGFIPFAERMRVIYECAEDKPQNKTVLNQKAYEASKGKFGINLLGKDIDMMVDQKYLLETKGDNNSRLLVRNPNKQP